MWDSRPTLITMLTLGFYVRPWIKVDYPDIPSLGRFESTYFRPEEWKPEYPNPAFTNARPDDLFWAARILAGLSDDGVRAVVGTAQYTRSQSHGVPDGHAARPQIESAQELVERHQSARQSGAQPVAAN